MVTTNVYSLGRQKWQDPAFPPQFSWTLACMGLYCLVEEKPIPTTVCGLELVSLVVGVVTLNHGSVRMTRYRQPFHLLVCLVGISFCLWVLVSPPRPHWALSQTLVHWAGDLIVFLLFSRVFTVDPKWS